MRVVKVEADSGPFRQREIDRIIEEVWNEKFGQINEDAAGELFWVPAYVLDVYEGGIQVWRVYVGTSITSDFTTSLVEEV